ncbi:MAG: hypothetical protein KatS3mg023_3916 [Armatimonadota bacterium]|nr:MAG: hypothetical protein KatS3mg023_3916 [Armatimonadota bacterium]
MNAVVYCRVSSDKQLRGRDYTSLDVQREECLRFLVNEFPDATLLDVVEETVSAADTNRPGLTRIIQLVEARAVDLLIVYMWSRLVRDPWDSMYLRRLCQQRGIRIRCAKEEMVNVFLQQLESDDPMQRWMAETMLFNLDQALKMERIQISKRTRENMRRRVLEGRYPGRTTPFGYILTDGGLLPDPQTAPLVRDAFQIYIETHSPARVRDYLNLMTERRWSVQTVRYMLSNPVYKGVLKWADLEIEGVVPAIVDADTWERAQTLRVVKTRRVSHRADFDWYLRGRIWCACGYAMTGYSVRGKKWTPYYLCMSVRYGRRSECPIRHVNAHRVHEAVTAAIAACADEEWIENLFADGISTNSEREEERARLQRELQQVRLQIDLLLGALQVEGEVRSVVKRIRELEEREKEIQYRIASLGYTDRLSVVDIRDALRHFASAWEAMTEAERHEVISLVVRSVRVKRKDAFDIQLVVPSSNMWEEWLPTCSPVRIDAKVVDLPGAGTTIADIRLGGTDDE